MLTNIPLEEARELLMSNIIALPGRFVLLEAASGRVCYQDTHALHDLPPFLQSAVDGYAVSMDDGADDKQYLLKESLRPGDYPGFSLKPGQAAGVVTGGPVPPGTRAVIPREFTELKEGYVTCLNGVNPGDNLKKPGEDFYAGDMMAKRGTILSPGLIGALAAYGVSQIKVFERPKVAVLSLGREIVPYHQEPAPGQTRDSNGIFLAALARRDGAEVTVAETAGDMEPLQIKCRLEKLLGQADVVLTTGGAASGIYDQALNAIRLTGARPLFWGVRMKPGSHSGAAIINSRLVIALSGNPAACAVGYHLLVTPVLRALQGLNPGLVRLGAVLRNTLLKKGGPRRFVRGHAFWHQNKWQVSFAPGQKSSMLRSLINYNALIDLPAGHPPVEAGQEVSIILLPSCNLGDY
ncbi:molybdopterin molybdotransferase MoeA [Desulfotruncus alcoholivorax]|uniref:molybdopterin molybdotransferase MoeA n=1 Tax=Desulfotruncus alcoholivorax TaxID=265477 RepID=UPI0003FD986A|nr:molybdopterin molybdotransferase MoeA [Desulfotruncus alcoholivorax]